MHAASNASGTGTGTAAPPPAPPAKPSGGKTHSVSVSFHKHASISGKIDWQGRSGHLCRSATPFKFVGMAKLAGTAQLTPSGATASGHAEASGKTSGGVSANSCEAPRSRVPATPAPKPIAHADEPGPAKTTAKPTASDVGKAAPINPSPAVAPKPRPALHLKPKAIHKPGAAPTPTPTPTPTPAGPTPAELESPKEPPAEPPSNVFGYEAPVLGCFEGQVFPLAVDAPKLPTDYASLTPVSVVYACEWDIAPRQWDQGFPGIADRFEWFAIRYAGAFRVATAGDYAFRISSDDGAKLSIDGKLVIDNDGQHPPQEARGTAQLSAGDHQMVLEYFQGPRYYINLQLWVTPPGKAEELFTVR